MPELAGIGLVFQSVFLTGLGIIVRSFRFQPASSTGFRRERAPSTRRLPRTNPRSRCSRFR